ncbi:CoA-binding protein [candidate division KSB1 bacterium]|nr:CoA-binding protein [candidate division KSB1 bacterium]
MTSKATIDNFLAQKKLAVVGVSRNKNKFGNIIFRMLKERGYQVYPINPNTATVERTQCYPSLEKLPEKVDGIVINVPPGQTLEVLKSALELKLLRVWLQQGSESNEVVSFCLMNQFEFISGHCIIMFAEPVGFGHRIHRWIWKILGKLPQ